MNKCMIWIPMCGLFLTCTDNSFLFHTYIHKIKKVCICLKGKIILLRAVIPCSWLQIPILTGPLLEVNCLAPLTLDLTLELEMVHQLFIIFLNSLLNNLKGLSHLAQRFPNWKTLLKTGSFCSIMF
jgi:hypothetical protein